MGPIQPAPARECYPSRSPPCDRLHARRGALTSSRCGSPVSCSCSPSGAAAPPARGRGEAPGGRARPRSVRRSENFEPVAFGVEVVGNGRPIIFIPGLGCPGEVWDETVAHLGDDYECPRAHALGVRRPRRRSRSRSRPRCAATSRATSARAASIDPIVVGHSMGGFIAYWLAAYHPELVGPVIIVDAGPGAVRRSRGGQAAARPVGERHRRGVRRPGASTCTRGMTTRSEAARAVISTRSRRSRTGGRSATRSSRW